MNDSRTCPNDNSTLLIRRDDDENIEYYCPQCHYWEYADPELNSESELNYFKD